MEKNQLSPLNYTKMQIGALTFLRVLIGWHFLYEGLVKLYSPGRWTSEFFLLNSVGPFSSVLKSMAANHALLYWVDMANMWGLILIGIFLFLGIFAKPAGIMGIVLLFLYYMAYPPFACYSVSIPVEGSYWIVNKNLIELAALVVLWFFPSSHITGIDRYLYSFKPKN